MVNNYYNELLSKLNNLKNEKIREDLCSSLLFYFNILSKINPENIPEFKKIFEIIVSEYNVDLASMKKNKLNNYEQAFIANLCYYLKLKLNFFYEQTLNLLGINYSNQHISRLILIYVRENFDYLKIDEKTIKKIIEKNKKIREKILEI